MKFLMPAIRLKIFMTLLLGLIYPFTMTGLSHVFFRRQASGDLVSRDKQVVGSNLIGQNFEEPRYFWGRPSAISYNSLPSGGSNLSQINPSLKATVEERKAKLKAAHPEQGEPPQDLIFASGSGLDPHISVEAAQYQVGRVAKARNLSSDEIKKIVKKIIENRQLGVLGEPTVNVLALNRALDKSQGLETAPILAPAAGK